jgi:serine/threonine protein kinase
MLTYALGNGPKDTKIYMVFPYMDHDLAGLLENDRVKFTPSQIKLYMKQLLEGTEYLHRVFTYFLHPLSRIFSRRSHRTKFSIVT